MKNKFYIVFDKFFQGEMCNIVIAKNSKEAKKIGRNVEATECADYTDIRVNVIKGNSWFWTEDENGKRIEFTVGGNGFVYIDKKAINKAINNGCDVENNLHIALYENQYKYELVFLPQKMTYVVELE